MLSGGKTCLLRSAIFVGLASVVTTILYFTPAPGKCPELSALKCDRSVTVCSLIL
jgi:hypothetical protein